MMPPAIHVYCIHIFEIWINVNQIENSLRKNPTVATKMRDKVEKWRLQWTISCLISQLCYTPHKIIEEQKESSMVSLLVSFYGPKYERTKNCVLLNFDYVREPFVRNLPLGNRDLIIIISWKNWFVYLEDLFKLGFWPPTNIAYRTKWL